MPRDRWGTFSVKDHRDAGALVPELLLYDRLVFPLPAGNGERERWRTMGWDPDLLERRIASMPGIAQGIPWDETRRARFDQALVEARQSMGALAGQSLPYAITGSILAQDAGRDQAIQPEVVAAYASFDEIRTQYLIAHAALERPSAEMTVALCHKFAVPMADKDPEAVLLDTIRLVSDPDFKHKRRALYAWRARILSGSRPYTAHEAVEEMTQLTEDYNRCVTKAMNRVYWKFAFTVGGAMLSTTGAVLSGNLLPAFGAIMSLVQFARMDRSPVVQAGDSAPAAMFHDVQRVL